MKRITDMSVAEYQRLAKRLDQRFSADKSWNELPVQHAPGRPLKGEKRERLTVHSIKMTTKEWKALQAEAKTLGITVNLKNAVEKYFTAKPQRAQRTYIKNKIHPFGEVVDHTKLNSKPCLSLASLRLCGGNLNSY